MKKSISVGSRVVAAALAALLALPATALADTRRFGTTDESRITANDIVALAGDDSAGGEVDSAANDGLTGGSVGADAAGADAANDTGTAAAAGSETAAGSAAAGGAAAGGAGGAAAGGAAAGGAGGAAAGGAGGAAAGGTGGAGTTAGQESGGAASQQQSGKNDVPAKDSGAASGSSSASGKDNESTDGSPTGSSSAGGSSTGSNGTGSNGTANNSTGSNGTGNSGTEATNNTAGSSGADSNAVDKNSEEAIDETAADIINSDKESRPSKPGETDGANDSSAAGSYSPSANAPLAAGSYYIRPFCSLSRVLDIANGSQANGANVQIYNSNRTPAQVFTLSVDKDGYYTIKTSYNKALDVYYAKAASGTNVWQYQTNGTKAQKWQIRGDESGGYEIVSALSNNNLTLCLDVNAAKDENCGNIQIYKANNTKAQRFQLISTQYYYPGSETVSSAIYTITPQLNTGLAIDIPGASGADNVQAQLYTKNGTLAQSYRILWDGAGYRIQSLCSGRSLGAQTSSFLSTTPVVQTGDKGYRSQRWQIKIIKEDSNGILVEFRLCESGLALEVQSAKKTSGALLWMYTPKGTEAQRFYLKQVAENPTNGLYGLVPKTATDKRMDIPGGSYDAGKVPQIYAANSTGAQAFEFVSQPLPNGAGSAWSIRVAQSGLLLSELANGKLTQAAAVNAGTGSGLGGKQLWTLKLGVGGYTIKNVASGNLITLSGNSFTTAKGSDELWNKQVLSLVPAKVAYSGNYEVVTPKGNRLTVSGMSVSNKAPIKLEAANKKWTQKFAFAGDSNGVHSIKNIYNSLALDIRDGSKASGAVLQQYTSNGTAAQRFTLVPSGDGWYLLRAGVGTWIAAGSDAAGADVKTTSDRASALRFRLVSTAAWTSGNSQLDAKLSQIMDNIGRSGDVIRKCYNYVSSYPYRNGSLYPTGNWVPGMALDMINNGSGNCYRYAALLDMLLKYNGYNCQAIAGGVKLRDGSVGPHSWVEYYPVAGGTYVLDAQAPHDLPNYNWYMITYSQSPMGYVK